MSNQNTIRQYITDLYSTHRYIVGSKAFLKKARQYYSMKIDKRRLNNGQKERLTIFLNAARATPSDSDKKGLIYDPLSQKNVKQGSKNYNKMMKTIVSGNFNRRGWSVKRKEALQDIYDDYVPLYLADTQEKIKSRVKKAVKTRRENVSNWAIQWSSLLYVCKIKKNQTFSRNRRYTETGAFDRSRDIRYTQIQALRNEKGQQWMDTISRKQDEFEQLFPFTERDDDQPQFYEMLTDIRVQEFKDVRGDMNAKQAQRLIDAYEDKHGVNNLSDNTPYEYHVIKLETYIMSRENLSKSIKLDEMLLYDENKKDGMVVHPDHIPSGRCLIHAVINAWGYGSDAGRKGVKEINDPDWLMEKMELQSLDNGANTKNLQKLKKALFELGYGASYYIIDQLNNFIARSQVSQNDINGTNPEIRAMAKNGWKFKWNLPPLYGWAYNNHFSTITDPTFQKSLRERVKSEVIKADQVKSHKKKPNKSEPDAMEDVEFVIIGSSESTDCPPSYDQMVAEILTHEKTLENQEETPDDQMVDEILTQEKKKRIYILKHCDDNYYMDGLFHAYIMKTKLIPSVTTVLSGKQHNSCIKTVILQNGNEIRLDKDFLKRMHICDTLNIKFNDQSTTAIATEELAKSVPVLKKSTLSQKMLLLMDNEAKPSIFYGNRLTYKTFGDPDIVAIDFPKFYRTAMKTMPLPFPVFTLFDEIEKYDPVKSFSGKKAGWYFIKTNNIVPAEGDGWYSNVIADKLQKKNIPHEITHMIIASRCIDGSIFKTFIDEMVTKIGKDAKLPINALIGSFGMKTTKKHFKSLFTQNKEEAVQYYNMLRDDKWEAAFLRKFHKEFHDLDLFQVTATQTERTFSTHRPLRKQIIDYANCLLHDFISDVVGDISKVLAIKTDCIVVNKRDVYIGNLWKYRIEKRIPLMSKELNVARRREPPLAFRSWTRVIKLDNSKGIPCAENLLEVLQGKSCRIQAPAGYGKSHLLSALENIFTEQGSKVQILAPTNMAADNVNGITIHKGLSISEDDIAHLIKNRPEVVLIDEISQIPGYLWDILYIYKSKGTRMFLFGDENQLPPVELWDHNFSDDYLNSSAVISIADGNLVELMVNHRFVDDPTNKMHEIVHNVLNEIPTGWDDNLIIDAERAMDFVVNIAFTNRMCQHVNNLHMNKLRTKGKRSFISARIPFYKNTQDLYLIKGSPLIACIANSKQGVIKGTKWFLHDWNETSVFCRDEKRGIECEVPRSDFQKHFLAGFCTTCHKAQGKTFTEGFVIHEKEKMSKRMLYTAVSRSSHSKHIRFSNITLPGIDRDELREKLSYVTGCSFDEFLNYIQTCLNSSEDLKGLTWNDWQWEFDLDHSKPLNKDGTSHYENIKPMRCSANRSKQDVYDGCMKNK